MVERRVFMAGVGASLAAAAASPASAAKIFATVLSDADWRARLGPDRYAVLREAATEPPFTSPLLHETRKGGFACAGCGQVVFDARTKFDSRTGWPSFWRPAQWKAVTTRRDTSEGMDRTEVVCSGCGGHLGHVFNDGPPPTGLRYCINGLALEFRPA